MFLDWSTWLTLGSTRYVTSKNACMCCENTWERRSSWCVGIKARLTQKSK